MARRIIAEFDAITGPFLRKLDRIDASVNRFERGTLTSFRRVEGGVNSIVATASRLRTITGVLATGFGANLATGFLDQAKLIRNALREAGDESEETFNKVFQSSVRALAGFRDTAQGVQRFQKALGDRQSIDASIRQLETLNKLLALSGKTTQERASTFIQFSQALQAGYLGGEELRAIRENAPIELTREIAKLAGGTIADLKKLSIQGKLTTDVMVQALKNLEEEADRRFGNINVTIQDAAKVFASGAIVAAEAFDRGLGGSAAVISGLKTLGEVLGESAEAMEFFGKAAQVVLAVLGTSFAGRRLQALSSGFKQLSAARYAEAFAAERQVVTSRAELLAANARLATAAATVGALRQQEASEKKLQAAKERQNKAFIAVNAAQAKYRTSLAGAAAATSALTLSSRVLTGTLGVLRGALGLLGGIPGLILGIGYGVYRLIDSIETTEERFARLSAPLEGVKDRQRDIVDLQREINRTIAKGIKPGDFDAQQAVSDLIEQFKQDQTAAQIEQGQAIQNLAIAEADLAERVADLAKRREEIKEVIKANAANIESKNFLAVNIPLQRELQQRIRELENEEQELLKIINSLKETIRDNLPITEADPEDWFVAIDSAKFRQALKDAEAATEKFVDSQVTALEKMEAEYENMLAVRQILVRAYGEEGEQVQALDEAMKRLKAQIVDASRVTGELSEDVNALGDALSNVSNIRIDIAGNLATVQAQIAALERGVSEGEFQAIPQAAAAAQAIIDAGGTWEMAADKYGQIIADSAALFEAEERRDNLVERLFGNKSKKESDDLKDALSYIEGSLTATERQRLELEKMIKLRDKLAKQGNVEQKIMEGLDRAIVRAKEDLAELENKMDAFWDGLSQQIANSITDWQGWGNFVRSVLASLVREYGPAFFTALLTPGKQGGSNPDLGSLAGDFVQALLFHDGGRSGRRRNVPAAVFAGAPRLHNGLMSDEFPAILQRGETVIPKNMNQSGGAGNATFVFNNDFRQSDPTMKPWIEAQLARQKAEFESHWISTARKMQNTRVRI